MTEQGSVSKLQLIHALRSEGKHTGETGIREERHTVGGECCAASSVVVASKSVLSEACSTCSLSPL